MTMRVAKTYAMRIDGQWIVLTAAKNGVNLTDDYSRAYKCSKATAKSIKSRLYGFDVEIVKH